MLHLKCWCFGKSKSTSWNFLQSSFYKVDMLATWNACCNTQIWRTISLLRWSTAKILLGFSEGRKFTWRSCDCHRYLWDKEFHRGHTSHQLQFSSISLNSAVYLTSLGFSYCLIKGFYPWMSKNIESVRVAGFIDKTIKCKARKDFCLKGRTS